MQPAVDVADQHRIALAGGFQNPQCPVWSLHDNAHVRRLSTSAEQTVEGDLQPAIVAVQHEISRLRAPCLRFHPCRPALVARRHAQHAGRAARLPGNVTKQTQTKYRGITTHDNSQVWLALWVRHKAGVNAKEGKGISIIPRRAVFRWRFDLLKLSTRKQSTMYEEKRKEPNPFKSQQVRQPMVMNSD